MNVWQHSSKSGRMRPRDKQRSKVYEAQHSIRGMYDLKRRNSFSSIKKFTENVLNDSWFTERYGNFNIEIIPGPPHSNTSFAKYFPHPKIVFQKHSHTKWVALHEISHHVVGPNNEWHGVRFCRVYLNLVNHYIGERACKKLQKAFDNEQVKY